MGFFSEIKSALNEIFSELSQPVILRDREYNCIIGDGGQQDAELERSTSKIVEWIKKRRAKRT